MERDRDVGGLELLTKAGAVLTLLETTGPASAAELATQLGEPLSSIYRLMQSLTAIGWVERNAKRGPYSLGLRWMTLGGLVEDRIDIRDACLPSLLNMVESTGATSILCVRRGSRAVCLERVEGISVQSRVMELGSSLPLHSGAASRALLAFLSRAEQDDALADEQLQGDPPRPAAAAILLDIAEVQSRGYAVSDGDVTSGVAALAAPVFNHRGEVEGALSLNGLHEQVLGPDVAASNIELILEAAAASSVALGWEPN